MVLVIASDPPCRAWLASLENPTRTRRGFDIYTLVGDMTSDWIKLHGQHEVSTERFILDHAKADATFLDIGANIGCFSLLAALAGRMNVVAFEPQRLIADLLVQSVRHNHLQDRVRVENLALSNVASTMKMTLCPGNTGHAQLVSAENSDAGENTVSVVVLDDWLAQNPAGRVSVCKIDTEGAEFQVLSGMTQLLDRDGPALVVELIEEHLAEFKASTSMVLELLKAHGYRDVSPSYAVNDDANRYFVKNSP
jgi:FkbM family methyltransferase